MAKWLKFVEINLRDNRKTQVWAVLTIDGRNNLGAVSWFGAWRRYTFTPNEKTTFEQDCLRDIAWFIEEETKRYKSSRKKVDEVVNV
jgi:hypothetical protein